MAGYFLLFVCALFSLGVQGKEPEVKSEPGLKIETLVEPSKDCKLVAKNGDKISMHYHGTLKESGKKFDASYDRKQPFTFTLGAGQVIKGWDLTVPGMCIGEKRRITLPPSLAYGNRAMGDIIPARSTLVFEIELMAINGVTKEEKKEETKEEKEEHIDDNIDNETDPDSDHDSFETMDEDKDGVLSSEEMTAYIKKFHDEELEGSEEQDSVETIVGEIFQEDDINKDGVISKDEYLHLEKEHTEL